jgi:DME family drug/metabolite transporter
VIGELCALGCAAAWASSTVIIKTQTERLDPVVMNAFRSVVSALVFVVLALATGAFSALAAGSAATVVTLAVASVLSYVVGDSLYYTSLALIGVSRTLPIAACYPALVVLFSVVFFGRSVTWTVAAGCALVAAGVWLVGSRVPAGRAGAGERAKPLRAEQRRGVLFALLAACLWSISVNLLGGVAARVSAVSANAVRLPVAALALVVAGAVREGGWRALGARLASCGPRRLGLLAVSALVGSVGGSLLFVAAVKLSGPAKAAILNSTAPLFSLPMAFVVLREAVTVGLVIGVLLSLAGIVVVMM